MRLDLEPMTTLEDAAIAVVTTANHTGEECRANFNGYELVAQPMDTDDEDLIQGYYAWLRERTDAECSGYRRMTDEEYVAARERRFCSSTEMAEVWKSRNDNRQCVCCGADSGGGAMLPPGWSHDRWAAMAAETGGPSAGTIAAFYCDRCAANLGRPERRNYSEDVN